MVAASLYTGSTMETRRTSGRLRVENFGVFTGAGLMLPFGRLEQVHAQHDHLRLQRSAISGMRESQIVNERDRQEQRCEEERCAMASPQHPSATQERKF